MTTTVRTDKALHAVALVVVGAAVLGVLCIDSLKNLFSAWPSVRLGFSGFVAAGLPLYPSGAQPAVGDIYGPMAAIFFLPALLGRTITADVLLAQALSVVTVGGLLVGACLLRAKKARASLMAAASVALVGLCVMVALPGLRHCLEQAHADAPSLFFGALSCLIWRNAQAFDYRRSFASALCFGLALWSKQTALPVLLGHVWALTFCFGVRRALLHALICICTAFVLFYALCFSVGAAPQLAWFYMVTVPRKHDLLTTDLAFVWSRVATLLLPTFAFAACLFVARADRRLHPSLPGIATRELDFCMLAVAGFALVPSSFLAVLKVGGYLNNLHAHYYLLLACCLAIVDKLGADNDEQAVSARLLAAVTLGALLLLPNDLTFDLPQARSLWQGLDKNPHQLAFDYLSQHDDAYFPWHPLSVVEAQHRAYTSFDARRTLAQARIYLGPAAAEAHPKVSTYVVFPNDGAGGVQDTVAMIAQSFPGYIASAQPPKGLEGFLVFKEAEAPPSAAMP